jgi:DNA-binding transcriptional MerR regulator
VADELTIDELSRRTGVTVRNIRAHQSRGLLPPPEIRSRTGYYGAEAVARLELIKEMQADGFNLRAIESLIHSAASSEEALGFKRALTAPFETEEPEMVDRDGLAERFGVLDPKIVRRAEKAGILVPLGDDRWEVPSPTLLRAGEQLAALGVSVEAALKVMEQLQRSSDAVAEAFVRLFVEDVLKPFERAGRPPDQWPRVREAIEQLRPMASEALVASFGPRMTQAVERAFGRHLSNT